MCCKSLFCYYPISLAHILTFLLNESGPRHNVTFSKISKLHHICSFRGNLQFSVHIAAALFSSFVTCVLCDTIHICNTVDVFVVRLSLKICAFILIFKQYAPPLFMTAIYSLCLQGWSFQTAINTLDFHCGCLKN